MTLTCSRVDPKSVGDLISWGVSRGLRSMRYHIAAESSTEKTGMRNQKEPVGVTELPYSEMNWVHEEKCEAKSNWEKMRCESARH